jgi:hypothetical protein
VCGSQNIAVLDITNPGSPKLINTVASNVFNNVSNLYCYIESGNLIAFADTGSTLVAGTGPSVSAFSLANPSQPQLLQQTGLNKTFVSGVAHHTIPHSQHTTPPALAQHVLESRRRSDRRGYDESLQPGRQSRIVG